MDIESSGRATQTIEQPLTTLLGYALQDSYSFVGRGKPRKRLVAGSPISDEKYWIWWQVESANASDLSGRVYCGMNELADLTLRIRDSALAIRVEIQGLREWNSFQASSPLNAIAEVCQISGHPEPHLMNTLKVQEILCYLPSLSQAQADRLLSNASPSSYLTCYQSDNSAIDHSGYPHLLDSYYWVKLACGKIQRIDPADDLQEWLKTSGHTLAWAALNPKAAFLLYLREGLHLPKQEVKEYSAGLDVAKFSCMHPVNRRQVIRKTPACQLEDLQVLFLDGKISLDALNQCFSLLQKQGKPLQVMATNTARIQKFRDERELGWSEQDAGEDFVKQHLPWILEQLETMDEQTLQAIVPIIVSGVVLKPVSEEMGKGPAGADFASKHFNSNTMSDLTVQCGDLTLALHRQYLAMQSPVLQNLLYSPLSGLQPEKLDLSEWSTPTILNGFSYLYNRPVDWHKVDLTEMIAFATFIQHQQLIDEASCILLHWTKDSGNLNPAIRLLASEPLWVSIPASSRARLLRLLAVEEWSQIMKECEEKETPRQIFGVILKRIHQLLA